MSFAASFHALHIPPETRRLSPPPYFSSFGDLDTLIPFHTTEGTSPVEIKLRKASTYSCGRRQSYHSLRSNAHFFGLLQTNGYARGSKSLPATGLITKTYVSVIPTGPVFEDATTSTRPRASEGEHSDSEDLWLADQRKRKGKMHGIPGGEDVVDGLANTPMSTKSSLSPDNNTGSRSFTGAVSEEASPTTEASSGIYSSHSSAASLVKLPKCGATGSTLSLTRVKARNARKVFITAAGLSLVPHDSLEMAHKRFAQRGQTKQQPRKKSKGRATTSARVPAGSKALTRPRVGILCRCSGLPSRAWSEGAGWERDLHVNIQEDTAKPVSQVTDCW